MVPYKHGPYSLFTNTVNLQYQHHTLDARNQQTQLVTRTPDSFSYIIPTKISRSF